MLCIQEFWWLVLAVSLLVIVLDFLGLVSLLHAMTQSQGHAEAQEHRLAGRNPYAPTAPVLGGLRAPQQQLPTKLCVMVGNHRPVKLVLTYQRYNATSSALSPVPGFMISPLTGFVDADIIVVESLSDIDTVRSDHLAAHPNQK